MIRSSSSLKGGLIVVSTAAHAAVAYALFSEPQVQIAGGADVVVEARLGNSFEDLAAGAEQPLVSETPVTEPTETEANEPPVEAAETIPKETLRTEAESTETVEAEAIQANPAPTEAVQENATLATPSDPSERIESLRPEASAALPVLPIEARPPDTALPTPAPAERTERSEAEVVTEVEPDVLAALQPPPPEPAPLTPVAPASPSETLQPAPETPLTATTPPVETISPADDRAIEVSPRPPERPERETREARQQQPQPAPQGNSNRNATAGSAAGSQATTRTQQSTRSGQSTASGNAAVSNYPGLVMRAISRVRKPRVGSRATVTIRFSVSASGGLASVAVARSSGNERLDLAAVQIIRRAAPFPKPPPGASRSFSIPIQGGG